MEKKSGCRNGKLADESWAEVRGIIMVREELDNILRMSLVPRAAPDDK